MDNMWLVWLGLAVVFLIIELATVSLVSIWFVVGSLVGLCAALLGASTGLQITLMLIVSLLGLGIFYLLRKKIFKGRNSHVPTNADAVIGDVAVVIEDIDQLGSSGQVKVRGQIWHAIAENSLDNKGNITSDDLIKAGEKVEVVAIKGVKLVVRPLEKTEAETK